MPFHNRVLLTRILYTDCFLLLPTVSFGPHFIRHSFFVYLKKLIIAKLHYYKKLLILYLIEDTF